MQSGVEITPEKEEWMDFISNVHELSVEADRLLLENRQEEAICVVSRIYSIGDDYFLGKD